MSGQVALMREWLASFGEGELLLDHTGEKPGQAALFPTGRVELWRRLTIDGGERVRVRYGFAVYKTFADGEGWGMAGTAWAAGLEAWVAARQQAGEVPAFGDGDRLPQIVRAERGARHSSPAAGCTLYVVKISVECTVVA